MRHWGLSYLALIVGLVGCVPRSRGESEGAPPAPKAHAGPPGLGEPPESTPPASVRAAPAGLLEARADPPLVGTFRDDFDRAALGVDWRTGSTAWKLEGGRLCVSGARNQGLWLKRRLPANAKVEFKAVSYALEGDIKAELWGDGASGATGVSYQDATSYLIIFGGWNNRFHVLARLDEHSRNRLEIKLEPTASEPMRKPVVKEQIYLFRLERLDGRTVQWFVDDKPVLALNDPDPLQGPGHEHFGFNDWQSRVCFDDLVISTE